MILIVDDAEDSRALYPVHLKEAGYRVEQAATGLEALEKAAALRPVLIVTDLGLPDINGFDLVARWKATPQMRATAVIVLSGRSRHERVDHCGLCDLILEKPCEPDVLEREIGRLLRRNR